MLLRRYLIFEQCSLALRACEHEEEGWYAGLQLFDKVSYEEDAKRDCPPDKVIYSTAIKICGKARLWKRAEEILKLRHILIDPPDERDYSQLINSTEKHKDGRRAVIWMKEMKRLKVTPSVFSFNAAISACGKSFMPGQAVTYLVRSKLKSVDLSVLVNFHLNSCNYYYNTFFIVHFSFNIFSVTISLKQTQTVVSNILFFSGISPTTSAQCVAILILNRNN